MLRATMWDRGEGNQPPAHPSTGHGHCTNQTDPHIPVLLPFQLIIVMTSAEVINPQLQLMALSCILSRPSSSQLDINSQEVPHALIAMACDF